MDLESLSTQSTNIYEFDFLKEQKDHLMGFISSEFEWDTILQNLILAKEENLNSFELIEYTLAQMMKKNPALFSKTFKNSLMEFMKQCKNIEDIAVLYEAYLKINESSSSANILCSMIEQLINFYYQQGVLQEKLFTSFYDHYFQARGIKSNKFNYTVEVFQRKIAKTFQYLIQPFYENFKNKEILFEPLMVWLMMLPSNQNSKEFKHVVDIAKIMKDSMIKKGFFGFSSDIDIDHFYKIIIFGFTCIKEGFNENDLIRGDLNFPVLFEMMDPAFFKTNISKIIDRFVPNLEEEKDIKGILGSLIDASYSQNVLIFLDQITTYYIKTVNIKALFYIFKNIILEKMLNKLTSSKYFNETLELLKRYLFGFSIYYGLSYEKTNILLKNYKIIFRHHKHNLQKFYEFLLCLFHLYREKQISSDNQDVFDFIRLIKETNNLDIPTQYTYDSCKTLIFELSNKNVSILIDLFEKSGLSTPKIIKSFKGLQNLGNTCYMNSLLQCLYFTSKFRKSVFDLKYNLKEFDKSSSLLELYRLFSNMENNYSQDKYLIPVEMKSSLPEPFCSTYQQQDVCEFSRILLEDFENQFNKVYKGKNLINSIFYGKVTNTIRCQDCGKSFSRQEDLMDIPLSFSEESLVDDGNPRYDLLKMILSYFATEEFSQENSFFCDFCQKKSSKALKDTLIIKLPPVLILSINRFKYDVNEGMKKKLFKWVKHYFSFNLKSQIFPDLPHSNKNDLEYQLFGVVMHSGFSSDAGHYFSICKDENGLWYLFNDTIVKYLGINVDLDEILSDHETPYMFFFVNKSENPLNLNYTERKSLKSTIFLKKSSIITPNTYSTIH